MLRVISLVSAIGASVMACAVASAQTAPEDVASASCPADRLSIYYARGESTPSAQAVELIGRISGEASRCNPDGIDLVTDIDTTVEGGDKQAVALALARLNSVAEVLIAHGIPADRIRMAASPDADIMHPPMGEVGVMFRKSPPAAGEAATEKRRAPPQQHPDVI